MGVSCLQQNERWNVDVIVKHAKKQKKAHCCGSELLRISSSSIITSSSVRMSRITAGVIDVPKSVDIRRLTISLELDVLSRRLEAAT